MDEYECVDHCILLAWVWIPQCTNGMHMSVGVPTCQERKNNVFTYFSKLCSEAENINNKKNRHPE